MSAHGFDSIPPEIVAAIFQHCLPDPSDHLWPSSLEAPLLLAQICRRWREICLDTPSLWASIAFGKTRSIELLKEWLLRARHHPLTIYLKCEDKTRARMLVDVVKPYCLQWQDIHFALPRSAHCQLNTAMLPCLERLTLSSNTEQSDLTMNPVIIRDAPLLRVAKISDIPYLQVKLPLQQLTILHLTVEDMPHVIAVLRCCPNLVDLTCHVFTMSVDAGWRVPPVELRALRSLDIPIINFLYYLTAPRLERLYIRYSIKPREATISLLHEFVSRSSCALKFLAIRLRGISDSAAQIQTFFRAVNNIEHLDLTVTCRWAPLVEALHSVDVLPQLRRLEVHDEYTLGEYPALLLDLVAWRRTHGVLEAFELVVTLRDDAAPVFGGFVYMGELLEDAQRVPAAAIIAEFRALGEAGLEVRIATQQRGDSTFPDVVLLDTRQRAR